MDEFNEIQCNFQLTLKILMQYPYTMNCSQKCKKMHAQQEIKCFYNYGNQTNPHNVQKPNNDVDSYQMLIYAAIIMYSMLLRQNAELVCKIFRSYHILYLEIKNKIYKLHCIYTCTFQFDFPLFFLKIIEVLLQSRCCCCFFYF